MISKSELNKHFDLVAKYAVEKALLRHKLLGEYIVVGIDGKAVTIPPEEIVIDYELLEKGLPSQQAAGE